MRKQEKMNTKRPRWKQFPTLERSLEMKASALRQLLGNRTGVKQFHSCKKNKNKQVSVQLTRQKTQVCSKKMVTSNDVEREIWLLNEYFTLWDVV